MLKTSIYDFYTKLRYCLPMKLLNSIIVGKFGQRGKNLPLNLINFLFFHLGGEWPATFLVFLVIIYLAYVSAYRSTKHNFAQKKSNRVSKLIALIEPAARSPRTS